jgi:hypothetical protein
MTQPPAGPPEQLPPYGQQPPPPPPRGPPPGVPLGPPPMPYRKPKKWPWVIAVVALLVVIGGVATGNGDWSITPS